MEGLTAGDGINFSGSVPEDISPITEIILPFQDWDCGGGLCCYNYCIPSGNVIKLRALNNDCEDTIVGGRR
jgi:hypothetical protein